MFKPACLFRAFACLFSAFVVLSVSPDLSSAQPGVIQPFGMGTGIVRENLSVGGGIGTSSLTFNDSSTVDQGVTMGVGCPDPNDPNCIEGFKITGTGGGGGAFGMPLLTLSYEGNMGLSGGLTLGGAFTLGPGGSFGTAEVPVPMMFTSSILTGELGLGTGGEFHTMMLSGDVENNIVLELPAGDPIPGATLYVNNVDRDHDVNQVRTTLQWLRVTDRADDVYIPEIPAGSSASIFLSAENIPSEGTVSVSPTDNLPGGLIIGYAYTNSDGNVTVILHNTSDDTVPETSASFFVTVMPYAPYTP